MINLARDPVTRNRNYALFQRRVGYVKGCFACMKTNRGVQMMTSRLSVVDRKSNAVIFQHRQSVYISISSITLFSRALA